MRVLLTGATGFVGRSVAARLLAEGCDVVAIGRRRPEINSASLTYVAADLGMPGIPDLVRSNGPFDVVVHAAAMISTSPVDTNVTLVNCYGTHQLVQAAVECGIPRFVYISGITVVGILGESIIVESNPIQPRTVYTASKAYGELLVEQCFGQQRGFITLRVTAPIGRGMPENRFLSVLIANAKVGRPLQIFGKGSRRHNYVDVRDVANAVWLGLQSSQSGLFNIAGGSSVSNLDLARICIRTLASKSEVCFTGTDDPEESHHWEVSIDSARQTLGYEPHHSLESSLLNIVAENPPEQGY